MIGLDALEIFLVVAVALLVATSAVLRLSGRTRLPIRQRVRVGSASTGASTPRWSRGMRLRVGLVVAGLGLWLVGLGELINTLSFSPRFTVGSVLSAIGFLVMSVALFWIAFIRVEV